MKKCVGYCRTSTENQKEEKTIELQVESLKKYAQKNGYEIVEWFMDAGISGGLESRPELVRLMGFLESNTDVSSVLIYKLDRLARDLYIQEGLIREFSKFGKELISTVEPDLGSNDPTRKLFRQIIGAFSEFEKAMITLRMKTGRDSAVSKGRWHGGQVYGYDNKDGQLIINRSEAEIIKKVFYLKRYKQMSPYRIACALQMQYVPTKRGNTQWRASSIIKILNNKLYRGIVKYKGQIYEGKHDTIIK